MGAVPWGTTVVGQQQQGKCHDAISMQRVRDRGGCCYFAYTKRFRHNSTNRGHMPQGTHTFGPCP